MPDMSKELIHALNRNTYINALAVQAVYRGEQFKESSKVPKDWRPYTVIIPGQVANVNTYAASVLPRNPMRSGFTISNLGSGAGGTVLYSNRGFDPNEVAQQLTIGQGVIDVGLLSSGQSISIVTSGPVYAAAQTATGATLAIIETVFLETTRDTSIDQQQLHAYRNVEAEIQHLVKDLV